MNEHLFFYGTLELILSLVLGVIILYFNYSLLFRYLGKKYGVTESNLAFAMLVSAILFSVGYLMTAIIQPILTTLRLLSDKGLEGSAMVTASTKHVLIFLFIGMLVSLIINLVSIAFYTTLTKVKEFEEISKNNVAVGLVTGVTVITMTLLARDGMTLIIESFIPYPDAPNIF